MAGREWIGRALFEGAFIAVSLVAALALNEWKDARDRQARARDALAAMRLELQANSAELEKAIAGAMDVIGKIEQAAKDDRRYGGRLLFRPQLVSAAWDSTRAAAIANDLPFPLVMALGRVYTLQADYQRDTGSFYNTLLSGTLGDIRANPELMAGLLNEMNGSAGRLAREYKAALKVLASQ